MQLSLYKKCYAGNSYWYDSCGNREELYDDCSITEECINGSCIGLTGCDYVDAINRCETGCSPNKVGIRCTPGGGYYGYPPEYCDHGACVESCASGWSETRPSSGTYETSSGECICCGNNITCYRQTCTETSWSPGTSSVCSGVSFTQTSNCGTTRTSTGSLTCNNYCSGSIRYYSGSCSGGNCSYSTQDCNTLDSWHDTGNTRWIQDIPTCIESEQKEQVYKHYYCESGSCSSTDGATQWVDTGNTRDIPGCSLEAAPVADINCDPNCTVYKNDSLKLENTSTDVNDNISLSTWIIEKLQGSTYVEKDNVTYTGIDTLKDYIIQTAILGIGIFRSTLTVEDSTNLSDTTTEAFYINQNLEPGFNCSLDEENYMDCNELSVGVGEIVYVEDDSIDCQNYPIISRIWEITDNDTIIGNETAFSFVLTNEETIIRLIAECSDTTTDSTSETINAGYPLPQWNEVRPE